MGKWTRASECCGSELIDKATHILENKYYNLFRSNFKWKGIDYRQENFIMSKLWKDGTIAAFSIENGGGIAFAKWVMLTHDMYDEPISITLINNYSSDLVPSTPQTVDENVVIGYLQSNRKGLYEIVKWYIDRIAQVEGAIAINLQLQKMPFFVPVDSNGKENNKDKNRIQDAIERIINNEIIIYLETQDPHIIKAISTNTPYVIDKLENYKKDLENDLKTYMGVNNPGINKIEQLQLGEINANNDEVNDHANDYIHNLKEWCKRVKEVLGYDIDVEPTSEPVSLMGQQHQFQTAPGPKKVEEDDENV